MFTPLYQRAAVKMSLLIFCIYSLIQNAFCPHILFLFNYILTINFSIKVKFCHALLLVFLVCFTKQIRALLCTSDSDDRTQPTFNKCKSDKCDK